MPLRIPAVVKISPFTQISFSRRRSALNMKISKISIDITQASPPTCSSTTSASVCIETIFLPLSCLSLVKHLFDDSDEIVKLLFTGFRKLFPYVFTFRKMGESLSFCYNAFQTLSENIFWCKYFFVWGNSERKNPFTNKAYSSNKYNDQLKTMFSNNKLEI